MTKHQKLTLILTLTLSLVFVVFTPRAFGADFWGTLTAVGLTATVGWIFELIMQLLGIGIWIGGAVFDLFLSWGNFLAEPSKGGIPIIVEAWEIIRDFVNVSFIFVLLTIAISTILGIEKYGIKALFAQLVIMALLVNFSLVLVRVVLDTSNLVTNFFIEGSGVGGLEMSQKLVGSLGIQKVWNAAINYDVGAGGVASTFLISMIMGIVVLLATLIVIWLAAGLLVFRIIILAFVAIFAPAAFLARIIPGGQSLWAKWWKTLINWALFTPAFAFFLYLAMRTADTFSQIENLDTTSLDYQAAVASFFSLGNNLIQYILVLGFTLGGLLMAKQFGVYGGAQAFAMGSKALKQASGYSFAKTKGGKYTKEQFKNLGQRVAGGVGRLGESFQNLPKGLKYTVGLPAVAPAFLAQQASQAFGLKPGQILAQQRKAIGDEKEKIKDLSAIELHNRLRTARGAELSAVMEKLAEDGDINNNMLKQAGIDDTKIQNILKTMENSGGNVKSVLKHRIDWAEHAVDAGLKDYKQFQGTAGQPADIAGAIDQVAKLMSAKDAAKMSSEVSDAAMTRFLEIARGAHLQEIALNGSTGLINRLQRDFFGQPNARTWLQGRNPTLVNYFDSNTAQQVHGWNLHI